MFRRGSGREAVAGSSIVLVTYGVSTAVDHVPIGDTILGLVVLVLPAVLGASGRLWATSWLRELDEYVHDALRAGARGFLLKDAGPGLLTQAIHTTVNG